MFDDPDLQSALEGSFTKHSAPQTHVVLPHDGAQRSYRVDSSGTRELAVLHTFDQDANLRPLGPGYSRLQQTRVSESGTRALVVEHDIEVNRTPMILVDVTVCDLATGQPSGYTPL